MLHETICNNDFQSNAELHLYQFNDIVSICFNIVPTLLLLKIVVANSFFYLNITLNRFTQVVIPSVSLSTSPNIPQRLQEILSGR